MNSHNRIPLFEEKTQTAIGALEELGHVLINQALFDRLAAATEPLDREQEEKIAEAQALRQSYSDLKPRIEAKVRILSGEIDSAVAAGRDNEAQEKRHEARNLKANLEQIPEQARVCDQRVQAIAWERHQLARGIFEETWPDLREALISAETALADLLDKVWGDLQRYASESGLQGDAHASRPMVTAMMKSDLTPRETGPEKPAFLRLLRWFGPAR